MSHPPCISSFWTTPFYERTCLTLYQLEFIAFTDGALVLYNDPLLATIIYNILVVDCALYPVILSLPPGFTRNRTTLACLRRLEDTTAWYEHLCDTHGKEEADTIALVCIRQGAIRAHFRGRKWSRTNPAPQNLAMQVFLPRKAKRLRTSELDLKPCLSTVSCPKQMLHEKPAEDSFLYPPRQRPFLSRACKKP